MDCQTLQALCSEALGRPVRSVTPYCQKGGWLLADADGTLCFLSGGTAYAVGCHPYEPCTRLTRRGAVVCTIRNGFYPDELRALAQNGGTVEAITGSRYDAERVCALLDCAIRCLPDGVIDEVEYRLAVERLRQSGAVSPKTALPLDALGLRLVPKSWLRGRNRDHVRATEDGRCYIDS